jgi:hypothetical protein
MVSQESREFLQNSGKLLQDHMTSLPEGNKQMSALLVSTVRGWCPSQSGICLFNDAVSSSDCIVSDGRLIDE